MRIALVGYGKMGRSIEALALEQGHEIAARVDPTLDVGEISSSTLGSADVAIEFTTPEAAPGNLVALAGLGVDTVCGTTGWSAHLPRVREAVVEAGTGLLFASNFSLGVQLFYRAAKALALAVNGSLDEQVTISETHHRHKVDTPSGTAITLAEALLERLSSKDRWESSNDTAEADATGDSNAEPDPRTLLISSMREGEIPGTHTVVFGGPDDRIELTHRAESRAGFVRGALAGADWIRGRVGVFTMDDYLSDRLGDVEGKSAGSERTES